MFELGSIGGNKMEAAAALRQPPPVLRQHSSPVKNVMRLLKRSQSASHHTPMEKYLVNPIQNQHHNYHHHHASQLPQPHRSHGRHNQFNNNCNLTEESRIVNCIEGLPFVMGSKKKVV